ncbi:hypothetical protein [Tsuneonella suprasediminis]|uniref:hypothetical protein n=1 Tax=Tsuneonella suprasediminis TaxID=2306996 RepID=UPI002F9384B8
MKVRTIRKHGNSFGSVYVKNIGRKYEVSKRDAMRLIAEGLVEEDIQDVPPHSGES